MNDSRDTLVETIKANPVPAALAGIGIAWLLMNRSSSATRGGSRRDERIRVSRRGELAYGGGGHNRVASSAESAGRMLSSSAHGAADRVASFAHDASEAAGHVGEQIGEAAGHALDGASDLAGRVATRTSDAASAVARGAHDASASIVHGAENATEYVTSGVRTQARRVERGFHTALEDNPLALGAAAVAIGALVGYSLPRTHGEDALMGGARDEVMHRAGEASHGAAEFVGQLATRSVDAAKDLLTDGNAAASS